MAGKRKWTMAVFLALVLLLLLGTALFAIPDLIIEDFRISVMGPDGSAAYDALDTAVAYNPASDDFFAVWSADDNTGSLVDGELEIYGQRVEPGGGSATGSRIRISVMGTADGDPNFDAQRPAVVYNPNANEYLVVWHGDDNTLVDDNNEIFAQRINGTDLSLLNPRIRVSNVTSLGANRDALNATVAYSTLSNRYLVAWQGDYQGDNEYEIYGAIVDAGGIVQVPDFRISTMGPDGDAAYRGQQPAAVYNSSDNEFYVVWSGDDNAGSLAAGEYEIYGRRLDSTTGAGTFTQQRLSTMGPDGSTAYTAQSPAVAYDPVQNGYLVVWHGDDDAVGLVDNEFEIFGRRVAADGSALDNDVRISFMEPAGSAASKALHPAVASEPGTGSYQVVWRGDEVGGGLVDNQFEIFGQAVSAADASLVGAPFRVSSMSQVDGSPAFGADKPAVTFAATYPGRFVSWRGHTDTVAGLAQNENEVFAETAVYAEDLALGGGWNMISSYIAPGIADLPQMLAPIASEVVMLKNGNGEVYWPALSINEIGSWNVVDGYQLNLTAAQNLRVVGSPVDSAVLSSNLNSGWNLVGYWLESPAPAVDAWSSISSKLVLAKNGNGEVYWPDFAVDNIGNLQPGEGYQVFLSTGGTLSYAGVLP